MADLGPKQIRKDRRTLVEYLDELDQRERDAKRRREVRCSPRVTYRMKALQVEFAPRNARREAHLAPSRNLSRNGVALLVSHFVYPGTPCRLQLMLADEQPFPIAGVVTHCRYLVGSGTVHEVGIRFEREIDVAMFDPRAAQLRLLIMTNDEQTRAELRTLLAERTLELRHAHDSGTALTLQREQPFDAIIADVAGPPDGFDLARSLRRVGFDGPVVALTRANDVAARRACFEAGCSHYLARPLTLERLAVILDSLSADPPAGNLLADDQAIASLDLFVTELPDRIAALDHLLQQRDLDGFGNLLGTLKQSATALGFNVLTNIVSELESALADATQLSVLEQQVGALVKWCDAAHSAAGEGGFGG